MMRRLTVRGSRRGRGFTLPEVLAALAIVGIVLPFAMQAIASSVRVAGDARRRAEATQLARQKLDEVLIDRASNVRPDGSGTFPPPFDAYSWTVASSDAGLNTTGDLTQIQCTVKWVGQGTERGIVLSTLVAAESTDSTDSTSTQ